MATPDDSALYFTTLSDDAFYPQINAEGVGTSTTPAMAVCTGRMHLVWRGTRDGDALHTTIFEVQGEGPRMFFLWPY